MNNMGNIFDKFSKSKVSDWKSFNGVSRNNKMPTTFGDMIDKTNVPFQSGTKAAVNPTSDGDENGRAPQTNGDESMTPSSKGGASGDGPTPGYTGSGSGITQLDGAHSNDAARKLAYGN